MKPGELVRSKLQGVSKDGKTALCPGHDDKRRSLSIGIGDDGRVLLKCHAGCSVGAILKAIGLEFEELFPKDGNSKRESRGRIVATYDYTDGGGKLLSQTVRYDPKDFHQRRPDGRGGWIWNLKGVKRVPYRLPKLIAGAIDQWVFITEGEKDADALTALGLIATTNSCGAGKWTAELNPHFVGRRVVIIPDNDDSGEKHVHQVARELLSVAREVRLLRLPGLLPKGDVSDWLANGGTKEKLLELVEKTEAFRLDSDQGVENIADRAGDGNERPAGGDRGGRKSQATRLVELAEDLELFHDADRAYGSFVREGEVRECHPVRSSAIRDLLRKRFWEGEQAAPNGEALQGAIGVLEAKAKHDGPEEHVHLRVADLGDRIAIDLGDDAWRAVEITSSGWRVGAHSTRFRRSRGMRSLPEPERGGSIQELRPFVNVATDEDFTLLVACAVAALSGRGPFPVLGLSGEQGSAKSTTARIFRDLIDPNVSPVRAEPRDVRDLMIAGNSAHVISLDNLSNLSPWLSDALCRLSTGGGLSTRELYSDDEEIIFDVTRPVVLNGIEDVATRPDLVDRSVLLSLPRLKQRRDEKRLWSEFRAARPRIFGALLDALVAALDREADVDLHDPPRMADFARLLVAAEPGLGWKEGTFLAAYNSNREAANDLSLESSIIGMPIRELDLPWSGTATDLLRALEARVTEQTSKSRGWPKSGRGLRGALARITPNLRAVGIEIKFPDTKNREGHDRQRILEIIHMDPEKVAPRPSASSAIGPEHDFRRDSGADDVETDRPQPSARPSAEKPPKDEENSENSPIADGADGTSGLFSVDDSESLANPSEGAGELEW